MPGARNDGDLVDDLRQGFDHTTALVAAVRPDQLDRPTPCGDFDVRALLDHLVAANLMFADIAGGGSFDPSVFQQDHIGDGDAAAAYRASADAALAAWSRPGATEGPTSFAGMPGDIVIGLHLAEELGHGWDLARATGQDTQIPARLADAALTAGRRVPAEMFRQSGAFGPEVDVPDDAPPADRLAGFLGRDPAATPG